MRAADQETLAALESRLRRILPEEYQETYDDVQPVSMGSAGLKYRPDGKVAWDEIWDTFCDLAMAGGPPHKGKLLEPGSPAEIDAAPEQYQQVVDEIRRGIRMVTDLTADPSPVPGWVRVECDTEGMAGWLVRAIVMENVAARSSGTSLDLPAGPAYRVEKEVKNVITSIAKTCHYWQDHMWRAQQREIGDLFAKMEAASPLIQPGLVGDVPIERFESLRQEVSELICQTTGLRPGGHHYARWVGLECVSVHSAIWLMRAIVVSNVLARREGTVLFVPVNPLNDPTGNIVAQTVVRIHGFAVARGVL